MERSTLEIPYNERDATVVGGNGQLGGKTVTALQSLGFRHVRVCEKGDPFRDFIRESTDIFFTVDDKEIVSMLQAGRDLLTPQHSILDGSSVKKPLIPPYKELDSSGISVCSTHVGSVPAQPWRGIKVWLCQVGLNSRTAQKLGTDLFLSTNSSIRTIDIEEHENVERDQWITMATAHILASALREVQFPLSRFDDFATLNAELLALPIGRTLGQGTHVPSEVLFNQPRKWEFLASLKEGLAELEYVMDDRQLLEELMQRNIDFHNNPEGFIDEIFRKAGIIGARNANLRMFKFSFRITDDKPGILLKVLEPFYKEGANLTAIDSMPGIITEEERQRRVNPDGIVDIDIGIDPSTIDDMKEQRIKDQLIALGCSVS